MSLSEDSAQGGSDTQMDIDDDHFVQPAPPDPSDPPAALAKGKPDPEGPANTIMITNKYSNAGVTSQTPNSNIMILTSHNHTDVSSNITSSSQINICINNHFSDSITSSSATVTKESADERLSNGMSAQQQLDEPDSTTCHFKDSRSQPNTPLVVPPDPTPRLLLAAAKNAPESETTTNPPPVEAQQPPPKTLVEFVSGDEVLVLKGDIFYLGTIIVIGRKQACVYFGDDTKCWFYFDEMRKLNVTANGDTVGPICVHCKERSGKEPDSVVDVCKRCQRGYHKKCTEMKNGIHCRRCFEQNSLNGVNGGKYFNKNNNSMGDERLFFSDNSLSPFDTGNFFPLRTSDNKDAWSGLSNNSDLSTASSNGNHKGRKLYTCGRRLRERQEKNYAESTRRPPAAATNPQASTSSGFSDASSSSSSSSSLLNFSATTFLSQQLLSSQRSGAVARGGAAATPDKGGSIISKIFDTRTPSNFANGEKYVIRGKRIDVDGNIQYLIEWEGVS